MTCPRWHSNLAEPGWFTFCVLHHTCLPIKYPCLHRGGEGSCWHHISYILSIYKTIMFFIYLGIHTVSKDLLSACLVWVAQTWLGHNSVVWWGKSSRLAAPRLLQGLLPTWGTPTELKAWGPASPFALVPQRPRHRQGSRKSSSIVGWHPIMPGPQKDSDNSDEVLSLLKLL